MCAVEVMSPADRIDALEEQVASWLSSGTAMVWVVDPRSRTVTVHRDGVLPRVLREHGTLTGEEVVPECALPVAEVFA